VPADAGTAPECFLVVSGPARLHSALGQAMLTPTHSPDLSGYKLAMKDVILRTFISLIILAVGCWIPKSYFDQYPNLLLFGPGPLAEAAFFVSKVTGFVYGAMALWSLRCAFVALWAPRRKLSGPTTPCARTPR